MLRRSLASLVVASGLVGCSHAPDTVVHFSAPASSRAWTVREPRGASICTLPCSIELEEHETVVVHTDAGRQFVLSQDNLGKGVFSGSVRVRKEPGAGALAVQAFSSALVRAGAVMASDDRRDDRVAAGIVLGGIGTAGVLASEALPGKTVEELWVEKIAYR